MAPVSPYQWDFVTPGLPDAAFEAAPGFSPTPMELRVMLLAHLRPRPDSVVWDVGGGTGALALEIARLLPGGRVQALERDPEAVELLQRNRARFVSGRSRPGQTTLRPKLWRVCEDQARDRSQPPSG